MEGDFHGSIVAGKFRIDRHIHKGRHSQIYEATDVRDEARLKQGQNKDDEVLTKVVVKLAAKTSKAKMARLRREGAFHAILKDVPSVPKLYWAGSTPLSEVCWPSHCLRYCSDLDAAVA